MWVSPNQLTENERIFLPPLPFQVCCCQTSQGPVQHWPLVAPARILQCRVGEQRDGHVPSCLRLSLQGPCYPEDQYWTWHLYPKSIMLILREKYWFISNKHMYGNDQILKWRNANSTLFLPVFLAMRVFRRNSLCASSLVNVWPSNHIRYMAVLLNDIEK